MPHGWKKIPYILMCRQNENWYYCSGVGQVRQQMQQTMLLSGGLHRPCRSPRPRFAASDHQSKPGWILFRPVAAAPGRTSSQVDRRSYEQRVQVVLGLANVACGADAVPAHQRREASFHSAAVRAVLLLECVRLLPLACGLRFLVIRPEA